jgi:hypothetical protein
MPSVYKQPQVTSPVERNSIFLFQRMEMTTECQAPTANLPPCRELRAEAQVICKALSREVAKHRRNLTVSSGTHAALDSLKYSPSSL